MKKLLSIAAVFALVFAYTNISAQEKPADKPNVDPPKEHGTHFVDANGDGFNDNAPDHDGDGIPNGVDPDYTGSKFQKGKRAFIDLNGDGINDNAGQGRQNKGKGMKGKYGPGNGTGNQGVGPQDGTTGNGAGNSAGTQDGTGTQKRGKGFKGGKK
ncbi:MAG: hypothetical protein RBS48_07355 [Ignavibacteriaceae bacterium]|nr:MAG: hypothetical protein APF79_09270 [bacterium BRH_c32]MDX9924566.1 hypothetical protein [Ignavibacteriaceae bacterium]